MRIYNIVPCSWECTLAECPTGLFRQDDHFGLKTEYYYNGHRVVYTLGGEIFWGGVGTYSERDELIVTPCVGVWEEV